MISREDYRTLYETAWQDRAAAAGWDLRIEYPGAKVRLRFHRHPAESPLTAPGSAGADRLRASFCG
jgi:hypothetical protein